MADDDQTLLAQLKEAVQQSSTMDPAYAALESSYALRVDMTSRLLKENDDLGQANDKLRGEVAKLREALRAKKAKPTEATTPAEQAEQAEQADTKTGKTKR